MKVRFVCNLPGDEPGLTEVLEIGLCDGCPDPTFVEADPSWRRVGFNLVGPPLGAAPVPGDVGIYEIETAPQLVPVTPPPEDDDEGRLVCEWTGLHRDVCPCADCHSPDA